MKDTYPSSVFRPELNGEYNSKVASIVFLWYKQTGTDARTNNSEGSFVIFLAAKILFIPSTVLFGHLSLKTLHDYDRGSSYLVWRVLP